MRTARRAGREGAARPRRVRPARAQTRNQRPGTEARGLAARFAKSHVKGSRGRRR